MISISFALALIAIVFGAKLLAQSQKENLGGLYKYLAWFVIVMGLLMILCDAARGVMGMCHRGHEKMINKECMMMGGGDDGCMMGGGNCMMGGNCNMMMMHHHHMCYDNNCGGMMNCGGDNNCSMHGGGQCSMMMDCKDSDKDGSCKDGGMSGSCPMMGGMKDMKDKKDTAKAKK